MRSLLTNMLRFSLSGGPDGLLAGKTATIAIAGGLSLLTVTSSLYLFMFVGRGLLPSPPTPDLTIARSLDPVPLRAVANPPAAVVPTPEPASEPAVEPAAETLTADITSSAGSSVAPIAVKSGSTATSEPAVSSQEAGAEKAKTGETDSRVSTGESGTREASTAPRLSRD